ncbi:hypothetical protein [Vibrio phage BUCT194]|uniref:DNA-directed RNA polymerase n=1 Tax=Vibrio phage BUCT194 TaxID=2859072 RepID=A0AAE9BP38_9CAUD|nr:hypothetical protein PP741_gp028 [Vibrio phage BUCT194]UAW01197.1 hypothetical protein [Vibrio phage BUCT194]
MSNVLTEFTPFEYLLIHIAGALGKDKLLFEERIEYVKRHARELHKMVDDADDKPAFVRGLIELENYRKGNFNSGMMCGLDGTASGLQMLSVMSGCVTTATNVGLVDPNKRCDVYTEGVYQMNKLLHPSKHILLKADGNYDGLTRDDVKDAIMTKYYGSVARPEAIFGKGTQELAVFYAALRQMNPGAEDLMEDLLSCIDVMRTQYSWIMPDGFNVICNVIAETTKTVEIQELPNRSGNPSTFSHIYKFIGQDPAYVATAANGAHSCDSLVVREMHRRVNHDKEMLTKALSAVRGARVTDRSQFVSVRMANAIVNGEAWHTEITESMAGQLAEIIEDVLEHPKYPLVTVHDEFKSCLPAMGVVRHHYRNILAEVADSELATQMLRGMYDDNSVVYHKQRGHEELSSLIRQSRYAIC